jgi:hypothetical protein
MTIVIKKVRRMPAVIPRKWAALKLRGKIMPGLSAPERQKTAFFAGSSCGKAARQVACARCPWALFDKIPRSQFGLA